MAAVGVTLVDTAREVHLGAFSQPFRAVQTSITPTARLLQPYSFGGHCLLGDSNGAVDSPPANPLTPPCARAGRQASKSKVCLETKTPSRCPVGEELSGWVGLVAATSIGRYALRGKGNARQCLLGASAQNNLFTNALNLLRQCTRDAAALASPKLASMCSVNSIGLAVQHHLLFDCWLRSAASPSPCGLRTIN